MGHKLNGKEFKFGRNDSGINLSDLFEEGKDKSFFVFSNFS